MDQKPPKNRPEPPDRVVREPRLHSTELAAKLSLSAEYDPLETFFRGTVELYRSKADPCVFAVVYVRGIWTSRSHHRDTATWSDLSWLEAESAVLQLVQHAKENGVGKAQPTNPTPTPTPAQE